MKKYLSKCFTLASFVLAIYVVYLMFSRGFVGALETEIKRYSDININYIYLMLGIVLASFPAGWISSKLHVTN